jgi:hypothetical protein
MRQHILHPLAVSMMLALAACSQEPAAPETPAAEAPAAEPAPEAAAAAPAASSVRALMVDVVVPASDAIWNAVSYRSTPDGVEMVAPETDEAWENVRFQAMQLIDASRLLTTEGFPVKLEGETLLDEGAEGNLTPEQIEAAMAEQRPALIAAAGVLEAAANEVIAAVDTRDVEALSNAGGTLDQACEACHLNFWYPAAP